MDLRYRTQKTQSPSVACSSRSTHESRFHHGEQNLRRSPDPNTAPPGSIFELIVTVDQRYLTQKTASQSVASSSRSTRGGGFAQVPVSNITLSTQWARSTMVEIVEIHERGNLRLAGGEKYRSTCCLFKLHA